MIAFTLQFLGNLELSQAEVVICQCFPLCFSLVICPRTALPDFSHNIFSESDNYPNEPNARK